MLRRVKRKKISKGDTAAVSDDEDHTLSKRSHHHVSDAQLLFGGVEDVIEKLAEAAEVKKKKRRKEVKYVEEKPRWEDRRDDDTTVEKIQISERDSRYADMPHLHGKTITTAQLSAAISQQHEKVMGNDLPWVTYDDAKNSSEEDDDDDESNTGGSELLRSTGNYLTASNYLPAGVISLQKCTDINRDRPVQGKLKCVEFHPSAPVALTAGMDCTLALFEVNGKANLKIQSKFFERFPIYSAHFSPDGGEVVLGSKHRTLYSFDMMEGRVTSSNIREMSRDIQNNTKRFALSPDGKCIAVLGRDGNIHILSARSKEWIDSFKMNGSVEAVAFNTDGSRMFSHGDDGGVYVWDMNRRACVHRFIDDGCIQGTSLAVSNDDRYLAAGSHSGVVNIYDYQSATSSSTPRPLKAVMNLTTAAASLRFNCTSEILAMIGDGMENAVKLVHVPSMTVFSNFPSLQERLRIPACVDFSARSGYLAIGNNDGQALLYRLKHYQNY